MSQVGKDSPVICLAWHFDHTPINRISFSRLVRQPLLSRQPTSKQIDRDSNRRRQGPSSRFSLVTILRFAFAAFIIFVATIIAVTIFDFSRYQCARSSDRRRRRFFVFRYIGEDVISSREQVEMRFSPGDKSTVCLDLLSRFNSLEFALLSDIDAIRLFPSNSLGIARIHIYSYTQYTRSRPKVNSSISDRYSWYI